MIRRNALLLALLANGALVGCSGTDAAVTTFPGWQNTEVITVSRTTMGGGVAATTSQRPDNTLETVALDLNSGKKLWAKAAAMAGRLPGMGVQAPATVEIAGGKAVIVSVDPMAAGSPQGKWKATVVARDARTGAQKWARPVNSTFGPQRCGAYVCLSENTALNTARMVVLDPAAGKVVWEMEGIGEVEWAGGNRVVIMRLAADPVLESRELSTGKVLWRLPVENALGQGVDLSGGWAFGATGDKLIGYLAPYMNTKTKRTSTFGLFSVRLGDGAVDWIRPSVVRVYPSGNPALAPIVRPVDQQGQYGGFARLDGGTGRVVGQITATQVPGAGWWLAFPEDMSRLGFLQRDKPSTAFDLRTGQVVKGAQRGWSFCVTDPQPLKLKTPGFYSVAALCQFDLVTGKRIATNAAPPAWFTGSQNGWRMWRDEKGALHALKDGTAPSPGMYG